LAANEELGSAFKQVVRAFKKLNYYVAFDILNAADYGVPQSRERIVFIGSRRGEKIDFPIPTHDKYGNGQLPKWMTLRSAIGDLRQSRAEHSKFSPTKIALLKRVPQGGNWRNLPENMQERAIRGAYYSWGGRSGFLRRLAWSKPSPALVTTPDGNATCLCHPTKNRPLSVQEYARIQQFPDAWIFEGSTRQKYRQIGNAVPVGLGKVVGQTIIRALKKNRRQKMGGVVECMSVALIQKLQRSRRTYLNPQKSRNKTRVKARANWLKGKPKYRNETLVYAAAEVKAFLEKMKLQVKAVSLDSPVI
jgi:DNA (cytosine-5)-methyltransferase 1